MKDKVKNNRKLLFISLTSFSIVLLIISFATTIYDYISIENSIYISSKIISLDGNKNAANVSYTVNNLEYQNQVSIPNGSELSVNDTTMIRVSMKNPNIQITKHETISISTFALGLLIFVLTIKTTKKIIKDYKNIKALKLSGIYIIADIAEIFVNSNGKKYKNLYPYRLRCKYFNPLDEKQYTFDSEDTFINLNDVLNKYGTKSVVVYIDRVKPTNYYVDLESLIPHINLIDPIEFMKINSKKQQPEESDSNQSEEESKEEKTIEEKDNKENKKTDEKK